MKALSSILILCLYGCSTPYYPPHSSISDLDFKKTNEVFINAQIEEQAAFDAFKKSRSNIKGQYVLIPGSKFRATFGIDGDLSGTYRVSGDNTVFIPLIGSVPTGGLTLTQLEASINKELTKYYKKPDMVLRPSSGVSTLYLTGAFFDPREVTIDDPVMTLAEVLTLAEGPSDQWSGRIVINNKIEFAYHSVNCADLTIVGGDRVHLVKAGKVSVLGEVNSSGRFSHFKGLSLIGAISAAGGITANAEISEIELHRPRNNTRYFMNLAKYMTENEIDPLVEGGDIVIVPTNNGKRIPSEIIEAALEITGVRVGATYRLND